MKRGVLFIGYFGAIGLFYERHPMASFLYAVLFFILMEQSLQDLRIMEVSNKEMMLLGCVTILISLIEQHTFISMITGASCVSGVFYLIYLFTKGKGIGGADVKFMLCCGCLLGVQRSFISLLCSCLSALLYPFLLPFHTKEIPFIPFLSWGVYVTVLFT